MTPNEKASKLKKRARQVEDTDVALRLNKEAERIVRGQVRKDKSQESVFKSDVRKKKKSKKTALQESMDEVSKGQLGK